METIKVKHCGICPFRATEYDDFAVGHDSIDTCQLAQFYNKEDYIIDVYDMGSKYKGVDDVNDKKTPTWCPLLENKVTVSYE